MRKLTSLLHILTFAFCLTQLLSAHAHVDENTHTEFVTIDERGFTPESIEIVRGATVTWHVKGQKSRWIASGYDAEHDVYPEPGNCSHSALNSCQAIAKNDVFSFTFDHVGIWPIRDHLDPTTQMIVRVVAPNQKPTATPSPFPKLGALSKLSQKLSQKKADPAAVAKDAKADCVQKRLKGVGTYTCYAQAMSDIAYAHGSPFAVQTLYALQKIDPEALGCHFIAHGIGWGSYRRDPENWQQTMQQSSPVCSYGEQMGLIEMYVQSLPDGRLKPEDVGNLCGEKPITDCNHAVGHMMLLITNNDFKKAIDMCDGIKDKDQRFMCYHGAFMERFIGSNLLEHGLLPQNMGAWPDRLPLNVEICKSYGASELAHACWREIVHPAVLFYKHDPEKVFDVCAQAATKEHELQCKYHTLPELAGKLQHNFDESRKICELKRHDKDFRAGCYRTLVSLKMQFATLETARDSVEFCATIEEDQRIKCYQLIAGNIRTKLNAKEREMYCQKAPEQYRKTCVGFVPARAIVPRILQWFREKQ